MPVQHPFAAGREADVFLLDGGRVLRRYRTGADTAREAEIMAYAAAHGYPVPAVYSADGADMVMERLHGPTMAEAALAGRLGLAEGAAMLADLLRRLHELPARDGGGETVIHLDLHPENVLLTARGPVVIDWRNAGDGPGDLDTALTALILAQVAIGSIEHPLGGAVHAMLDRFLELAPGDPVRLLDDAAAFRRRQLTMSPDEIAMIGDAAARVRAGVR
ncbi:phosphotransferase [Actinoplanes sp. KI2]|uniref:phosphotransferase n=1 Tax=Actinoplanes sp. KI2 TaxID=2983315 RepID=UPI0021D610B6|nr:phosphotransferase [Actinoplanes sp. KI2]MCU7722714.1 phosphotransferase [Actinoplanes sp. KI2]